MPSPPIRGSGGLSEGVAGRAQVLEGEQLQGGPHFGSGLLGAQTRVNLFFLQTELSRNLKCTLPVEYRFRPFEHEVHHSIYLVLLFG